MSRGVSTQALLEVEGLTRRFGGVEALAGVSFRVSPGDVLGIIGPNGSGKTTMINCVTGFVRPSAGRVLLRGRDVTAMAPHRIARAGMTRTFQTARPFASLPAYRNLVVALSSPRARRRHRHGDRDTMALDLLEELGFERDSRLPRQLAGTLAAGYLKRLELGRCLALEPEVILLDEIFSGLSAAETASLAALLERLRDRGIALIMVEHRLRELVRLAGRLLALAEGRIIAAGEPRSVIDHPAVRRAYLGLEESA